MAFKKSVRITDEAAAIMAPLGSKAEDGMNWSGSINAMAEQFGLIIGELTPDFTDDQWKAVYCCFNGYIPHPDITTEASLLHWHISEGYQHDGQVAQLLGSQSDAVEFIDRLKNLSLGQRIAVIYKAFKFWRGGV